MLVDNAKKKMGDSTTDTKTFTYYTRRKKSYN
jgi:hypothetical protein